MGTDGQNSLVFNIKYTARFGLGKKRGKNYTAVAIAAPIYLYFFLK